MSASLIGIQGQALSDYPPLQCRYRSRARCLYQKLDATVLVMKSCRYRKLNPVGVAHRIGSTLARMLGLIKLIFSLVLDLFRSRARWKQRFWCFGSRSLCCAGIGWAGCHSRPATDWFWVGSAGYFQIPVCTCHYPAGDGVALASRRLAIVLALEVQASTGPSRTVR